MARPKFPSDEQEQFMVRMPAGMRLRIKNRAAANNRSMNAEIVSLLEESLIDRMMHENEEFQSAIAKNERSSVQDRLNAIEGQLEQILKRLDK